MRCSQPIPQKLNLQTSSFDFCNKKFYHIFRLKEFFICFCFEKIYKYFITVHIHKIKKLNMNICHIVQNIYDRNFLQILDGKAGRAR